MNDTDDPTMYAFASAVPAGCICDEIASKDRPCLPCEASEYVTEIDTLRAEHAAALAHLDRLARASTSPDADTELGEARGRVAGLARALELLAQPVDVET